MPKGILFNCEKKSLLYLKRLLLPLHAHYPCIYVDKIQERQQSLTEHDSPIWNSYQVFSSHFATRAYIFQKTDDSFESLVPVNNFLHIYALNERTG